jgi:AcrR family transcriptional regulator
VDNSRAVNPSRQRATLVNTRSRETRQALTRAALRLWSEGDFDQAYAASTAADIARAAGVSKGTFYFHFANKEAILLEMATSTTRALIDQVETGIAKEVPLFDLSSRMMASMARRVARTPKTLALQVGALGLSAPTVETPRLADAFEALLTYGVQRGELTAGIDVEEGAAMLNALTRDAIRRWGADDRSTAWLEQTLPERAAVVLRGISG